MSEAALELHLSERRIGPFAPTVEGGRQAALVVAEKGAQAVLAYNDLMAMGIIDGLRREGLSVPDQVSVVGFDNIFAAADLISPGLTTVAAPLQTIGETAVRNVLALGRGATSTQPAPTVVPARLIVRGSTAPPSE